MKTKISNQDQKSISHRLVFNSDSHSVLVDGREIQLRVLEFKLLQYFFENRNQITSRQDLLTHVWGYGAKVKTRTIDTHVKQLRKKLGQFGDSIETLYGFGYRLRSSQS